MEKEIAIRIRLLTALVLAIIAVGCDAPDDNFRMPVFPAELTAADFPGMAYPPQDGRMMSPAPRRGGVLEEAVTPERLRSQPVHMISEYPDTDRSALLRTISRQYASDPNREREMEKLRSLGYIQ